VGSAQAEPFQTPVQARSQADSAGSIPVTPRHPATAQLRLLSPELGRSSFAASVTPRAVRVQSARRDLTQVEENVGARGQGPLTSEQLAELELVLRPPS
jgi:hypothetical protein